MSKCKDCGAEIVWRKTNSGKSMPCDARPVFYIPSQFGSDKVLTSDGKIINCNINVNPHEAKGKFGFIPHWATCPKAFVYKIR